MLNRKIICECKLLNILNSKLEEHSICKDLQFASIQRIIPDGSSFYSCWKPELKRSGHPVVGDHPIALRIATEAQSTYRLK